MCTQSMCLSKTKKKNIQSVYLKEYESICCLVCLRRSSVIDLPLKSGDHNISTSFI